MKEGQEKPKTKAPKIQRLVTPLVLQRARRVKALKRARIAKAKSDANDYAKLLALRQKEKKVKGCESLLMVVSLECKTGSLLVVGYTELGHFIRKLMML